MKNRIMYWFYDKRSDMFIAISSFLIWLNKVSIRLFKYTQNLNKYLTNEAIRAARNDISKLIRLAGDYMTS